MTRTADSLLPSSLTRNSDEYLRSYLLLALLLLNLTTCVLTVPIYLQIIGLESPATPIAAATTLACASLYLLAYWLLTRRGRFLLSANITFATLLAVNLLATQLTGGFIESPVPQLTLFTPIFALVLFGMRLGLFWLMITVGLCLLSVVLSAEGQFATQMIPDQRDRDVLKVIFFFALIFMGTTALIFHELMYQNLQNKLKQERDSYVYQASHDMLTGLPNRFQFFEYFERSLALAERKNHSLALGYIDLDGFKPINDTYGHHAGDLILETIASRLGRIIRTGDMIARFGGDEFALLIPLVDDRESVETVVQRIVEAVAHPLEEGDMKLQVTCSVGIALYPYDAEDVDDLCQKADLALYRAKEEKNSYSFFEKSLKPVSG
ncbi:diguanylate cyclase (GGDEF)-like protein [Litorivivens lipolytica]|uniref:Diguanylate cyclase (GGDEF)-like protein n=1 Tax=Litorivivens lipolytica TaxID=1524264 RepID=A0A7W4Z5P6_9GAMM|nr:GGDEF domain-containing protein [Litorivivens lipolytica]MBB3046055.1 diguanylate cyclase (GGDEF)-like protein [Litorivivens lipolytica]